LGTEGGEAFLILLLPRQHPKRSSGLVAGPIAPVWSRELASNCRMARHMFGKMREKAKLLLENDPEFAVKFYSRAIKRAARDHGPQSPQVLNLRQDRAVAWHRNGESEKAEAELATLIAQRELTADAGDYAVRHAKRWHALVLFDLGRFDRAESESRRLSEEFDRLLGADDAEAIEVHEDHAVALAKLDRMQEAESEMADVVAKRLAAKGPDDVATLRARSSRAVVLDALGRIEESATAWRELAESQARVHGVSHPDAILPLSRYALALFKQRRLPEAAAQYRDVEALRAAALGADHPDTRRAQDWLTVIERELGRPGQAGPV
jgi:tetratricopeptide (TPR) repeat protein